MFDVEIKFTNGNVSVFKNQKLTKAISLVKSASFFGDVVEVHLVDKQPRLPK